MYSSKINIKLCGILYNYTDYTNTYIWFYFEVFDGWMGDRKNDKFFLNSIENYDSIYLNIISVEKCIKILAT